MAIILVVDDRETNREFLRTLLMYLGHRIIEAPDAETALAQTRQHHPDLIISDVLMPGIDGFEFVRRVRAEPAIAQCRVMFYTAAYMEDEARSLAVGLGVSHLLTKPTEPAIILETVQSILESPMVPMEPVPDASFSEKHQRLLLDKLSQKIDELETMNSALEQRVKERTADLLEANDRLRELNAFKDTILATTSHDLRSPMMVIHGMAEILLHEAELTTEARSMVQNIYHSVGQMHELVTNVLDLAQIETGRVRLNLTPVYVSRVVEQVFETLHWIAENKRIGLVLDIQSHEPMIYADESKLRQIIGNLVGNAIKFTPPQGSIHIYILPDDDGVCCEIHDTGIGIPSGQLPHIFQKFHKAHPHGTGQETGSGLGLSIVQQLVNLHGGTIAVQSEVGAGSVFRVALPFLPEQH